MLMKPRIFHFGLLLLAAAPVPALADVVWPALYLETRIFTWWAIVIGLLVEYLFVRWFFPLSPQRAAFATLAANAASTLAGVPLIPLAGLLWALFPGTIYTEWLGWGTFNPISWGAAFGLACGLNVAIESLVFKRFFQCRLRWRAWLGLGIANSLSVGVALASLFIVPARL
jgi:hypothetical protein